MSLVESQISEIVRGRLKLPTAAKLRIQKAIPNALQIFSERMAEDDYKRYITLTPKTVTGTPTLGLLDLAALVTSNGVMIDKLHLGDIYNQPARTFNDTGVNLSASTIVLLNNRLVTDTRIRFTTTGVLPAPLLIDTDYYVSAIENGGLEIYSVPDLSQRVTLTSVGMGTQTISTPDIPEEQPLSRLTNPALTSFPIAWMDTVNDKFWWLIGTQMHLFAGDGSPITTVCQFNVPRIIALSDFDDPAVGSLQDEFIDVITELTAQAEVTRDNP